MIRTIITPQEPNISINIPLEFIGKQVEILVYATEEIHEAENTSRPKPKLRGRLNLTNEQYADFQQYAQESRNEWNRNI